MRLSGWGVAAIAIWGVLAGLWLSVVMTKIQTHAPPQDAIKLIQACEAKLPRDEECRLVAIPAGKH